MPDIRVLLETNLRDIGIWAAHKAHDDPVYPCVANGCRTRGDAGGCLGGIGTLPDVIIGPDGDDGSGDSHTSVLVRWPYIGQVVRHLRRNGDVGSYCARGIDLIPIVTDMHAFAAPLATLVASQPQRLDPPPRLIV